MSAGHRFRSGLVAVAWALLGVLGGHLLTYAILYPDAHVHDAVLAESGHGWTALLGPAALTAVTVALTLGLLGGVRRDHSRGVRFTTLLLLQVGLFTGMELAERVASSGLTVDTLWHHLSGHGLAAILVLGSAIQALTAWLGSRVSRMVAAVVERLRPTAPRRRLAHPRLVPVFVSLPGARPVRAHGSRGPPSLVTPTLPTPWAA